MARPASPTGAGRGPWRTCIGCRQRRQQAELTRIVRAGDGSLAIGRTLHGRGAWLCRASTECLELAARQGGFARAFRASVRSSDVDALRVGWPDGDGGPRSDFVPGTLPARD
ncbi:MAG: YlxR family protein [Acidimicrobiia bacterium]|nr:YlxR family protein [Acidimicrobiia bacterium]